jgi:hypothetical protein
MSNTTITLARQILAQNERLLAMLEGGAPVTEAPKAERETRKARKTRKAAAPKVEATGTRLLTQDSRKAFIAAHDWAVEHTSTRALVEAVVVGGQPLSDGWDIGPKYRAMFADAPKSSKGKKGKARVAAQVEPEAPAKVRKPVGENHASQGPRDAKGRITPKETWETREALAMTGKVGREEIDALVDSGIRVTEAGAAALFA